MQEFFAATVKILWRVRARELVRGDNAARDALAHARVQGDGCGLLSGVSALLKRLTRVNRSAAVIRAGAQTQSRTALVPSGGKHDILVASLADARWRGCAQRAGAFAFAFASGFR
jgi:hypothetical protein